MFILHRSETETKMSSIKQPIIDGSIRAYAVDPRYLSSNFGSGANDMRGKLYPSSDNPTIQEGQVLLGKYNSVNARVGFVPGPNGMSTPTHDDVDDARRERLIEESSMEDYTVLGIAGTEMADWPNGKLISVVTQSPSCLFFNTGTQTILDGQMVCVRYPNASECAEHTARYRTLRWVTYGVNPSSDTNRIESILRYTALNKGAAIAANNDQFELARLSLVEIFKKTSRFLSDGLVPRYADWTEDGYVGEDAAEVFVNELSKGELRDVVHHASRIADVVNARYGRAVLGFASGDVKPWQSGRIVLQTNH